MRRMRAMMEYPSVLLEAIVEIIVTSRQAGYVEMDERNELAARSDKNNNVQKLCELITKHGHPNGKPPSVDARGKLEEMVPQLLGLGS